MPRPSWLAPPVRSAGDPLAAARSRISGNAADDALFPWPLMPENQPQSQPDISSQQPWNLRNARRLSPAFARIPLASGGVGVDWLALAEMLYNELLQHIDDKVSIVQVPFNIGAAPVVIRPAEPRRYFFILNTSAANNLFLAFDAAPTGAVNDFVIPAGGAFEPLKVPQNEIQILGAGANTRGMILYAN